MAMIMSTRSCSCIIVIFFSAAAVVVIIISLCFQEIFSWHSD